jgi:hypothetical protein
MLWLAFIAVAAAAETAPSPSVRTPSDHTLVYYNARMALREGHSLETVKLWLLRNALEDQTGQVSPHDGDFHSVTWAALGELGICQDGHPTDADGAGLWPLGLHNWVVRNMSRSKPPRPPRVFDAFEVGRQQRVVAIGDVLSAPELSALRLARGQCYGPRLALVMAGESVTAKLSDRQVAARLLRHLLHQSRETLAQEQVRGRAVIEARLFDLELQLTALAEREARMASRTKGRLGRQLGLSRESVVEMRATDPTTTLAPNSEAARILNSCADWPADEWMALSPERRLFLHDHARRFGTDPTKLDRIAVGIIDDLIRLNQGEEVEKWIARVGNAEDPASLQAVWQGPRGQRLLALDRESGFREQGVVALHRGISQLESGDLPSALRSMAFALQHAPDSRSSDAVQSLSRRWISYIAARFEITDELLVTLRALVPRRDYAIILEDLMWRAALHADGASFERGLRNRAGRGALDRRLSLLTPLATGDVRHFSRKVKAGLKSSPSETLRFLDQLLQRMELEDAEVRAAHVPTLTQVRALVAPLAEDDGYTGRRARTASALVERCRAIIEGLGGPSLDATSQDRAGSLAPTDEVFVGSLRLAPADPLPWPFRASETPAPSVFSPLSLTPQEWRGPDGGWVYGWSIGG